MLYLKAEQELTQVPTLPDKVKSKLVQYETQVEPLAKVFAGQMEVHC